MMARKLVTTIDTSGPFFTHDPRKTFRGNIRLFMAAVADEGQRDVEAQLKSGQAEREPIRLIQPNRVSGHVVGRTKSLTGKPWEVTAVISINNRGFTKKQGTRLMAAGSVLEHRIHAFRKTKNRLRRARAVNQVELLRGLK
jgi:hypothetical protein